MRKGRWIVVLTVAVLLLGAVLSPASLADRHRLRVIKFDGVVDSRLDGDEENLLGTWRIQDEGDVWDVEIVESTTVIEAHGELAVGAQVEVVAYETEEEDLVAIVVRVVDPEPRVLFIKGFVSDLGDEGDYMMVDGRMILLTEETHIVGFGELEEGALVHVVVRASGEELTAWHVVILPLPASRTIVMRGRVQALEEDYLVLHGITIYMNEDTVVENEELLAVDAYVKVKAQAVREGSQLRLVALHIKVYPEPEQVVEPEELPEPAGAAAFVGLR
ncbi:MAG: hypothetical protein JXA74_06260 [Anaerolineae bacterium]|nr:hypothetical protein [Anaerolineae bacterium]